MENKELKWRKIVLFCAVFCVVENMLVVLLIGYGFLKNENKSTSENRNIVMQNTEQTSNEVQLMQNISEGELKFSLPNMYSLDSSQCTENVMTYTTKLENQEIFSVGISDFYSNVEGGAYWESINDSAFQLHGFLIEDISEVKQEVLNGVIWYKKSVKQKSKDLGEERYAEYYYTNYKGTGYVVSFGIDALNGEKIEASKINGFSSIKNSLKFGE